MQKIRKIFGNAFFAFITAAAWFAFFLPWKGFNDPDAFYHAKITSLMMRQGALQRFPWLDLTSFDRGFTDHHYFFHVLSMPFERAFGMLLGSQIAAVVFAATFVAVFYVLLRNARVPFPWLFAFLLAMTPLEIVRLTLAKATPIALIWFILGLAAVAAPNIRMRSRLFLSGIAGFGFALSHGGWPILIACQLLFAFGETLFDRIVTERPWRTCFQRLSFAMAGCTLIGAVIGTILHPNFPTNISFLWIQIWKIAVVTPFHRVRLGNEWLPVSMGDLLASASMLLVLGLAVFYGLLVARRRPAVEARWRTAIAFGIPVAFLAALTFKSIRFAEYFFPTLAWWIASVAVNVDVRAYRQWAVARWNWRTSLLLAAVLAALVIQNVQTWIGLHRQPYPFGAYQDVFRVLAVQAKPNERIFHASWDQFPQLFAEDDRYRYVVGLDPTFLLEADPILSDRYHAIMSNTLATSTYDVIKNDFGSRWALVDPRRQADLDRVMGNDGRFLLQTSSTHAKLYRLSD